MSVKIILMSFNLILDHSHKIKRNFKHLVEATRPKTYVELIFKIPKTQMKYENHDICRYLVISYKKAMVKKLSGFRTFCHARCLKNEAFPKKFYKVTKEVARFVCKVTFQLKFELKNFLLFTCNMWYSMLNFW
jgi:hypothetical protein